jgi:hypothetical protein
MTGLPPPNVLSYEGQVVVPFINRTFPPTTSNYQFNVPTIWMDTAHKIPYILVAKPMNVANWIPFGGEVAIDYICDTGSATPAAGILNVLGINGVSTAGSGDTITISATEFVPQYTNVNHAASPYTVLLTDQYISVDCSGGAVTLLFPNAPTANRTWTVKDRTGNSAANNITVTTVGGAVNIDGATSYVIKINFEAIDLLANATPQYEVF